MDQTIELLDIVLRISQLVLGDLQVSLGPQAHIGDLIQTRLVFLLNFPNFIGSILVDLLHHLPIVLLHQPDILTQMSYLLFLLRQSILMVLFFLIGLLSVFLVQGGLRLAESSSFLLLLLLECLVFGCVLEHALRVFIASGLQLLVVLLSE